MVTSVARSTSGINNLDLNYMQVVINNIRNRVNAYRVVRAQDANDAAWLYNYWIQHTHSWFDQTYIAVGNAPAHVTESYTETTAAIENLVYFTQGFGSNNNIVAWQMNDLRLKIDNIRVHRHQVNDNYWM